MQLVLWLVGTYLVICVLGYFFHRHFMYFPDPTRSAPVEVGLPAVQEVELKTPDGDRLIAWFMPAQEGKPTVLYWTGNAGSAAGRAPRIETITVSGYGIFLVHYRGFGGSTGRTTEKSNVADGLLAYDYLMAQGLKPHDIVLYGESIGSGVATQVAAERSARALVLEAPLASTVDVGKQTYWFLPLWLLLVDQYRTVDNIKRVHSPVLILHGEQDRIIPVSHGQRIYEAANGPKQIALFPDGGHNDLFSQGAWSEVVAFIESLDRGEFVPDAMPGAMGNGRAQGEQPQSK